MPGLTGPDRPAFKALMADTARPRTATIDAFLDGRLSIRQPISGHRSGFDAVMLAAAAPARADAHIVDIGAGVGVAGLAALRNGKGAALTLLDIDPDLVELAGENVRLNAMTDQACAIQCDILGRNALRGAGLEPGFADLALMNPPFHVEGRVSQPPDDGRAVAHVGEADDLGRWVKFAASCLKSKGVLTLIHRADTLAPVLSALQSRFGDIAVLPLHPRPGQPASRVLVTAVRDSRAGLSLLPGMAVHGAGGRAYTPDVEAVLRGRAAHLPATGSDLRPRGEDAMSLGTDQ